MNAAHRLDPDQLAHDLGTRRIGRRILVLDELPSTNTFALETLSHEGLAADGAVIFAEHQTAGRGRLGRRWHSPRGASLMFTALLIDAGPDPPAIPSHPRSSGDRTSGSRFDASAFFVLAAAVALAQAIQNETDIEPVIRWPNDIYVRHRKLAGILIETRDLSPGLRCVAIGIGLNCLQQTAHFPPDLTDRATSLEIESTQPIDRPALARAILQRLDELLCGPEAISDAGLCSEWKSRSDDLGQRVTLIESGITYTGRILDLEPREGLLLQLDTGARRHFHPATTTRI